MRVKDLLIQPVSGLFDVGKEQTESCWAGPLWGKAKPPLGRMNSPLPNALSDKPFLSIYSSIFVHDQRILTCIYMSDWIAMCCPFLSLN
jgi:hypothetical protein